MEGSNRSSTQRPARVARVGARPGLGARAAVHSVADLSNPQPNANRSSASRLKPAASAQAPSLVDHAYDTIRRRILDNVYQPGAPALESELAAELGISRTPLREALIRLQNEGLIEIIPRHGMRVRPVSATDMKEIYEVLTALESYAVELVARRKPTPSEIKHLVDATRDMTRALKAKNLEAWAQADEVFHKYLIEACGNRLLVDAIQQYCDRAHRALMFSVRLRPRLETSAKEHMALVDRLSRGRGRRGRSQPRASRACQP